MATLVPRMLLVITSLSFCAAIWAQDEELVESRLAELLGAGDDAGFARAIAPRRFVFPDDHGPHPGFRNEWWYITGNVDSEKGRRFGFELTVFRFALTPVSPTSPVSDSNWRTNQVYIAHFAITDADRQRFVFAEKFSRGALGLAGAQADPFRVWIDDWELRAIDDDAPGAGAERWRLTAADAGFALDLELTALKPPVLNGIDGLSQKSSEPGNASYYYSITRWRTEGRLRIDDREHRVSGLSWLDREWSSSALAPDQQGWDWFALQLDDDTELMFYSIRKTDGSQDPQSAGTWVAADGRTEYLRREDVLVEVTDTWQSPQGGTYPAAWTLRLPGRDLTLHVEPVMADQELFTIVRYWEGAVDVHGRHGDRPVHGRGYVELTGYAE